MELDKILYKESSLRNFYDYTIKFPTEEKQQWNATHRLEVVYLHAKYEKLILNDKKVTTRTRVDLTLRAKS